MSTTFSSSQVSELTGITLRQLQWWDERGIVTPAREGHRRLYSPEDLAEIAVICELRRKGFSLQRVRKVMRFLQKELGRRLVETTQANSKVHLLADGRHLFLEDSERGVIDVLKNARQPLLAVCLSDAVQRVGPALGVTPRPPVSEVIAHDHRARKRTIRARQRGPDLRSALRIERSVSAPVVAMRQARQGKVPNHGGTR